MSTERFGIGVASNDSLQPNSYTMMPALKNTGPRGTMARSLVPTRGVNGTGVDDTSTEARARRRRSCCRLSIVWHTQELGASEGVPTSASGEPEVARARRVLCAVAERGGPTGTHRILDATWADEIPAGEAVFYLRTPRGLYASEVKGLGASAAALGAQFVRIHASTTAKLQDLERADVRLDCIVVHLAPDQPVAGHGCASLYPGGCTPPELEAAVYGVFDEVLAIVMRPLTLHARWLPGSIRPGTGPCPQSAGDPGIVIS